MEDDGRQPIWIKKKPHLSNKRIHPGIRHPSRIFTPAIPFIRNNSIHPNAQLKKIRNQSDVHPQLLMLLNDSKNLFSRQLPNMGSSYIARLVFDFNAESVIILHDGIVAGAITSRLFPKEEFIEIVFLAVETRLQSKGYGRLVMNYLKSLMQIYPYHDILACADNEAVDYFRKQGFNDKGIFMDPSRWVGRIKDYDQVTLVHCKIHPDIDYMNFHNIIDEQILFLEKIIGKHFFEAPNEIKNSFLTFKKAPTFISIPYSKIIDITNNKINGITNYEQDKIDNYNQIIEEYKKKMFEILNELENDEKLNSIFGKPVTEDLAPTYFDTIHRPMDFFTIKKRLIKFNDYYKTPEMFASDIYLIVDNCKIFNQAGTIYVAAANNLLQKYKILFNNAFPLNQI